MDRVLKGFQIFLILTFFSGLQVKAYPLNQLELCLDFLKFDKVFHPIGHLTGKQPLEVFCANFTEFLKCIENRGEFDPRNPPEILLKPPNGYLFKQVAKTADVTDLICRNGTQLREDYLENSQCYRNVYSNVLKECERQSYNTLSHFYDLEKARNNILGLTELDAMDKVYKLGCVAQAIQEECGDKALDTFKEILEMFAQFDSGEYSQELMHFVRTRFIDSLDMDESRKILYRECAGDNPDVNDYCPSLSSFFRNLIMVIL